MIEEHYDWSQDKFSGKERLFVLFYIADNKKCKTKAAIDAGYSELNANKAGHNVYKRPHVTKAIEWYLSKIETKVVTSAERVLEELALIAFVNPKEAFKDGTSKHKNVCDLSDNVARSLANVNIRYLENGDVIHQLEFNSKLKALELLGKHHKLFTDKILISNRPLVIVKDLSGRKKKLDRRQPGDGSVEVTPIERS